MGATGGFDIRVDEQLRLRRRCSISPQSSGQRAGEPTEKQPVDILNLEGIAILFGVSTT